MQKNTFWANHIAVFNHDHQSTKFRQTTVKSTVVDPSQSSPKPYALQPKVSVSNIKPHPSFVPRKDGRRRRAGWCREAEWGRALAPVLAEGAIGRTFARWVKGSEIWG